MFVSSSKSQTGKCFCFRNTLHGSWLNKTLQRKAKTQRPVQLSLAAVGRQSFVWATRCPLQTALNYRLHLQYCFFALFVCSKLSKKASLAWELAFFLLPSQISGEHRVIWTNLGSLTMVLWKPRLPSRVPPGRLGPCCALSTQAACAAISTATWNTRWIKYWAQSCSRHWHARLWHAWHTSAHGVKFECVVRCQPAGTLELRQSRGSDHVWVFLWSIWWLNWL